MFEPDLTLKGNEVFLVGRAHDGTGLDESGLYLRDTRFLSQFDIRLNGIAPETLSTRTDSGRRATIVMTNPEADAISAPRHSIAVEQRIELTEVASVSMTVQNYHREAINLELSIDIASDFLDMFAVRGWQGTRTGTISETSTSRSRLRLEYATLDGPVMSTTVTSSPAPDSVDTGNPGSGRLRYSLTLQPATAQSIEFVVTPDPADGVMIAAVPEPGQTFAFWSSNDELQRLMDRSDSDLTLLQTDTSDGTIIAAGIPWYVAPFGRDSLIVALQTMHVYPDRIASTLRVLAAHQGTKVDAFREEQPGKILHEMRYGELARSGQIPHTPYYGSIDSTPLFIMTFAQHYLWHRDESLWHDLIAAVRKGIEWIEDFGDLDGDGLIEFSGTLTDPSHISQQGWKDSHDSLHHVDGTNVTGPVALVEVQGYVYAGFAWLAEAARIHGDTAWATGLRGKAKAVRRAIEDTFWIETAGFYAQALDGEKRRVEAISSNPGHLLFCGVPSKERANQMADRLMQDDLYAGWGIRTLSSAMPTYNPMSYHNGSIWPHDTSLAMWGLREYGIDTAAVQLALGLVSLAYFAPENRLAELYCGWPHEGHEDGPVDYPVSCSPQAWAAGSAHLVLRTLLGIRPDFQNQSISIDPFLPEQFEAVSVANLAAYGELYDLAVHIHEGHYHVAPEGNVRVVVAGQESAG